MRTALAGAAALTALTVLTALSALSAGAHPAAPHQPARAAAHHAPPATARFARESVRYGDTDRSPSDIDHVRELQHRLTWAGAYDGPVTGYFGGLTKAAVQRYQRRIHVPASGVAGAANAWLVRGGGSDTRTRTGNFRVYHRDIDHVSHLYGSPMPYSQFFSGGEAFHGSATMVDPFVGHSHGCINMYVEDAGQLWALTSRSRLSVHVHGAWS